MRYNRVIRVELDHPSGQRIVVDGLRVSFEVERTRSSAGTNSAKINITNLAEATRNQIAGNAIGVRLFFGYGDEDPPLIYAGTIERPIHKNEPPNWTTVLEAKDGAQALREAMISVSFESGSTVRQVLSKLLDELGLPYLVDSRIGDAAYNSGYSFVGPLGQALDQVTSRLDLQWSVQNGEVRIFRQGDAIPIEAIRLTPETGLIGSPERMSDSGTGFIEQGNEAGIALRSFLIPNLEPGGLIQLESRSVSGRFQAQTVRHKGDNWDGDAITEVEATDA